LAYDVLAAATGRQGLSLLEAHHGGMLFTDVAMPGVNDRPPDSPIKRCSAPPV